VQTDIRAPFHSPSTCLPMLFSFVLLLLIPFVYGQSPADVAKVFDTTQIVPDVIPSFDPTVVLQVSFGNPITPGQSLTVNGKLSSETADVATANMPSFKIADDTSSGTYVILMVSSLAFSLIRQVDADAPSPPNRTLADLLHFLGGGYVASGPADSNGFRVLTSQTTPVTPYLGPSPPSGSPPHRYAILIYNEPGNFVLQTAVTSSTSRLKFNVPSFELATGLSGPIGGNMFYVGPYSPASSTTNALQTIAPSTATYTPSASATGVSSAIKLGISWWFRVLFALTVLRFEVA